MLTKSECILFDNICDTLHKPLRLLYVCMNVCTMYVELPVAAIVDPFLPTVEYTKTPDYRAQPAYIAVHTYIHTYIFRNPQVLASTCTPSHRSSVSKAAMGWPEVEVDVVAEVVVGADQEEVDASWDMGERSSSLPFKAFNSSLRRAISAIHTYIHTYSHTL